MSLDIRRLASEHPQWKLLAVICVILPAVVTLAVLAFAWPAARVEPRDLPVGVVGTSASTEKVVTALQRKDPGHFDLRIYNDEPAAREAIRERDVYGALAVSADGVRVLTASAGSPAVARLLTTTGDTVAHLAGKPGGGTVVGVSEVDVVASDPDDPQGLALSSALLPLTICSIVIAAVIALLLEFRPAWRMIVALAAVSIVSGLGVYLIAEPYLSLMPHNGFAAWSVLSLTILAMSATTAGLISMAGTVGLGIGAALFVFVGNPFSASTTAPELLPGLAHHVGQWLPPGAGVNALRSIVYFDGNDTGTHVGVLLAWVACGFLAILTGHHRFVGFAARREDLRDTSAELSGRRRSTQPQSTTTRKPNLHPDPSPTPASEPAWDPASVEAPAPISVAAGQRAEHEARSAGPSSKEIGSRPRHLDGSPLSLPGGVPQ